MHKPNITISFINGEVRYSFELEGKTYSKQRPDASDASEMLAMAQKTMEQCLNNDLFWEDFNDNTKI